MKDGTLWLARADGLEKRQLISMPEDSAITNHLWSRDGQRIYFNVGLNLFEFRLAESKAAMLGTLRAEPGLMIDRLELSQDGQTLLVKAVTEEAALNAIPRLYAFVLRQGETRELTVDEYRLLAPAQPAVVRQAGDLSVSPDGKSLLFREAVGPNDQLFVSDLETGARYQVTELDQLRDFDPSVAPDSGRRIMEATWSPDGRYIVFTPMQSCSELGLCFGRTYLVDAGGGAQLQLALEMAANLAIEWNQAGTLLVYDDGGQVLLSDTHGQIKLLSEGNQPRWQPG
ncbi:MAG: PD40 domain-containing protein [Deltaproteobacteria bacterium]|nr:PD40 domain-containing protein [Deltaproteobacteria bacterium]